MTETGTTAVAIGAMAFGTAGAAAGAGARILLHRMRRGARVRAPVCEAAVGAAWAGVGAGWAAGVWPDRWVPVLLALAWFGVAAGAVDLRHHRLPDALTLPAVPVAFLLVAPLGGAALARAGPGALAAVAVHAAVHLGSPGSLGAGDVKLAASLGAVLAAASWGAPLVAAVLASALTAAVALIAQVARAAPVARTQVARAGLRTRGPAGGPGPRRAPVCAGDPPGHDGRVAGSPRRWRTPVPHGPSMLLATAAVVAVAAAG
ncbi:prepilin peptidase [Pseudonocardia saturnea]